MKSIVICIVAVALVSTTAGSGSAQGTTQATGKAPLAAMKGPVGDKGPTGDKGPPGDKGPQGDRGPSGMTSGSATGYSVRVSNPVTLNPGQGTWITAGCAYNGKHVIGGGVWSSNPGNTEIQSSYPQDPSLEPAVGTGTWRAFVQAKTGYTSGITVKVYAICLDVIP